MWGAHMTYSLKVPLLEKSCHTIRDPSNLTGSGRESQGSAHVLQSYVASPCVQNAAGQHTSGGTCQQLIRFFSVNFAAYF